MKTNNNIFPFPPAHKKVTVGFDGYVDRITRVMRSQNEQFATLSEFGQYIQSRANRSGSLEVRTVTEKAGGNMPVFSQALSELGVSLHCIGAMGYPEVLPVFQPLSKKCTLESVSAPGYCQALEFDDGKLMLADNEGIEKLDYKRLLDRLGEEHLMQLLQDSDMIVLLNWSEMKESLSIWHGLAENFLSRLPPCEKSLFVDLSDCTGRPSADILAIVRLISSLSQRFDVSISFNRNEAERVAQVSNLSWNSTDVLVSELRRALGCRRLILHLVDGCYCAGEDGLHIQPNRYIEHPVLSTGGGDNFNAGFVYGLLCGMDCINCIRIANSVASFYVAHGYSPDPDALIRWMSSCSICQPNQYHTQKG